ncbi:hypothetical protein Plec18170_000715 [Paecilomyces lecythidis]
MTTKSLDLSLLSGGPEESDEFCRLLLETLKTHGVAKIKNHSISQDSINELFSMARRFFELPLEDKLVAKHPPQANPNRGYCYVGQESVGNISGFEKGLNPGKSLRDIKESFDMGASDDNLVDNIWIEEKALPGFRDFMTDFYQQCFQVELKLLTALSKALGLPESILLKMHSRAENEFRLLHYPTIPASVTKDGDVTRIAEHTDFGTITLLFQDSVGGLEVENQKNYGQFHPVASEKTDIIVNIGDSLQRLTNDTFKAACHRVHFPQAVKQGEDEVIPERFSIAYFGKPNRDASLLPLKQFTSEQNPCRYNDITAWEWNNLRIGKLFS